VRIVLPLSLYLLLAFCKPAEAYYLEVVAVDGDKKEKSLPDYKKSLKDSIDVLFELRSLVRELHDRSYITAAVDTIFFGPDTATAYVTIGDKWEWVNLRRGNVDGYLLDRTGFRERLYRNKPFRYQDYHKLEESFIKISENNGFPFASIRLDSIEIGARGISAALNYEKGPLFTFDSISIYGNTKTKKRYLMRHLRITKGMPYSQQRVDEMERMLRELPFLTQVRPPEVLFSKNAAIVNLFLNERKINQIDGIIGFLPNEGNNKKLLVTGELNLGLRNLLGTGKGLMLEWRKIKQASQILDMAYFHPKILGSTVDVNVNFNLFKQDSTFLTIVRKLTFIQRTGTYSKVNLNGGLKTSRPLAGISDTSATKFADFNHYTYGIGYDWNNLNDFFYPRRGWLFSLQGYLGNKTIRPNPEFDPIYYQGTKLKSVQFNLEGAMERYTRLGKGSVLMTRIVGGKIFNKRENIYFNDLYRIGGLRTLRGFNENNFFASTYGVATIEYRFFTDETSYLLLFYDQAYLANELAVVNRYDYPLGFGAGVSFTTPAGVFNFIYSVGNSRDQKISLNLSKIHFGIVSRF
jgi:translocation and assembly module TamA